MSANIKEQAHTIVDALPDDATWDDLSEKIHREQVEEQATQLAEMLESPDGLDQLSREASQLIQEREKSMTE